MMLDRLLAIDPGVNLSGWALFDKGVLISAGHDENLVVVNIIKCRASHIIVERPRTYGGKSNKGDTMDLLDLSVEVGFFCGVAYAEDIEFRAVLPQEWKGQTPKSVSHAQLLRRLTAEERKVIPKMAKAKIHNVLDAIALGCSALGRAMRPADGADL